MLLVKLRLRSLILLVDGVDEVPRGKRQAVEEWVLHGLITTRCPMLVTTRPNNARFEEYSRLGQLFTRFTIMPMRRAQQLSIVKHAETLNVFEKIMTIDAASPGMLSLVSVLMPPAVPLAELNDIEAPYQLYEMAITRAVSAAVKENKDVVVDQTMKLLARLAAFALQSNRPNFSYFRYADAEREWAECAKSFGTDAVNFHTVWNAALCAEPPLLRDLAALRPRKIPWLTLSDKSTTKKPLPTDGKPPGASGKSVPAVGGETKSDDAVPVVAFQEHHELEFRCVTIPEALLAGLLARSGLPDFWQRNELDRKVPVASRPPCAGAPGSAKSGADLESVSESRSGGDDLLTVLGAKHWANTFRIGGRKVGEAVAKQAEDVKAINADHSKFVWESILHCQVALPNLEICWSNTLFGSCFRSVLRAALVDSLPC